MRTVFQACQPRPEVPRGELHKEIFAAVSSQTWGESVRSARAI